MTRYLYGNTGAEYTIFGIRIPKKSLTDKEKARGKKLYTALNESMFTLLTHDKRFVDMLNDGQVKITLTPPDEVARNSEQESRVSPFSAIAEKLRKENASLKAELKNTTKILSEKERQIARSVEK
jgi:hypothetical protein